jgi:BolA family transcriptional regulator, general stress-responsive regulator
MSNAPSMAERITQKLQAALAPVALDVIDDSHKHAGHAHAITHAAKAGRSGETHFTVKVVSGSFIGKSVLARHRMVNDLLRAEFAEGIHALAIEAKAPGD